MLTYNLHPFRKSSSLTSSSRFCHEQTSEVKSRLFYTRDHKIPRIIFSHFFVIVAFTLVKDVKSIVYELVSVQDLDEIIVKSSIDDFFRHEIFRLIIELFWTFLKSSSIPWISFYVFSLNLSMTLVTSVFFSHSLISRSLHLFLQQFVV